MFIRAASLPLMVNPRERIFLKMAGLSSRAVSF
jgi:hypothetical protein